MAIRIIYKIKKDIYIWAVLIILCCFFLLSNLGNVYFWQDEAETALLARSVLKYGIPKSLDGNTFILQIFNSFRDDYVYIQHPWLQFYVMAAGFKVLGENTWAGRLPFAIIGILTILGVYYTSRRIFTRPVVALLSVLMVLTCVPLLLHLRQGRYYALSTFFVLSGCYTYLNWNTSRLAYLGFITSLTGLFQANFATFLPTFLAFGVHYFWIHRKTPGEWVNKQTAALLIILSVNAPWMVYLKIFQRPSEIEPGTYFNHLLYYFYLMNLIAPAILVLIGAFFAIRTRTDSPPIQPRARDFMSVSFLILLFNLLFLSLARQLFFRYLVPLIPLMLMMLAFLFYRGFQRHRILGAIFLFLFTFTNVLSYFPIKIGEVILSKIGDKQAAEKVIQFSPGSPLLDFIGEILQKKIICPNRAVAEYLNGHAREGNLVFTNFGDLPLMFYTGLHIHSRNLLDPIRVKNMPDPDWVIVRKNWPSKEILQTIINKKGFNEITLKAVDTKFGNNPDPLVHHFGTVTQGEPLKIYHRIQHGS
jgi:hypothetical protein